MKRIVIFASGSGSNAENLIEFFHNRETGSVIQILTNNPRAKVLDRAKKLKVSALSFNKIAFTQTDDVLNILRNSKPDLIILAGFLWMFPKNIINEFPNKVINIHPALLPKYGGKGMYGMNVHEAVVANKETETGITIHYVNEHYDEGAIIFQSKCPVLKTDSAQDVADKIHELEMEWFPKVVEKLLKSQKLNSKFQNRLFTNKEIQQKIFDRLRILPEGELSKYCDKNYSKENFDIDFPLLIKASKSLSKVERTEMVKNQDVNRWTWKFEIEKDQFTYALSTQWYPRHDMFVKNWLEKTT